jgi:DNA-binding MarR family transcriptional regulator
LITALPDPHDRRRRAIALTKIGRSVAAQATQVARRITRETLVPLAAAEQKLVQRLLKRLI